MTGPRTTAVTFDAAGTLIDVVEPVGTVYARIAAGHGIARPATVADGAFRAAMAAAAPLAFPGLRGAALDAAERRWWRAIVHHALGEPPADARFEACVDALLAHYADAAAWRVFPEVPAVLGALRRAGIRAAVVSNFDRRLGPLLAALGVGALLEATIVSSAVGAAKPDPAIWEIACSRLGTRRDETVHVGDRVDADVLGARRAGLGAMLVDRTGRTPGPDPDVVRIPDLTPLPGLLS